MWKQHVAAVHKCCSHQFWSVFNAVKDTSTVTKDKVLEVTKQVCTGATGHRWPRNCRVLRDRVRVRLRVYVDRCTSTLCCLRLFVYV